MKEREIRQVIAEVCHRLDERARQWRAASRTAVPAVVGAAVAVGGCGGVTDQGAVLEYGAPPTSDGGDALPDQASEAGDAGPTVEYGGPPVDASDEDAGVSPPYMGVFPDASDEDAGVSPPYMGVFPDASEEDVGPTPPYMGAFSGKP